MFDHQLSLDSESQLLFVFGGRLITPSSHDNIYSGLYLYDIGRDKWTLLR